MYTISGQPLYLDLSFSAKLPIFLELKVSNNPILYTRCLNVCSNAAYEPGYDKLVDFLNMVV